MLLMLICRARELTDEQRGAIASFLSVYKGQENGVTKLSLSHHPSLERAHGLLLSLWKKVRPPSLQSPCACVHGSPWLAQAAQGRHDGLSPA